MKVFINFFKKKNKWFSKKLKKLDKFIDQISFNTSLKNFQLY